MKAWRRKLKRTLQRWRHPKIMRDEHMGMRANVRSSQARRKIIRPAGMSLHDVVVSHQPAGLPRDSKFCEHRAFGHPTTYFRTMLFDIIWDDQRPDLVTYVVTMDSLEGGLFHEYWIYRLPSHAVPGECYWSVQFTNAADEAQLLPRCRFLAPTQTTCLDSNRRQHHSRHVPLRSPTCN